MNPKQIKFRELMLEHNLSTTPFIIQIFINSHNFFLLLHYASKFHYYLFMILCLFIAHCQSSGENLFQYFALAVIVTIFNLLALSLAALHSHIAPCMQFILPWFFHISFQHENIFVDIIVSYDEIREIIAKQLMHCEN